MKSFGAISVFLLLVVCVFGCESNDANVKPDGLVKEQPQQEQAAPSTYIFTLTSTALSVKQDECDQECKDDKPQVMLGNPASKFCMDNNGKLDFRKNTEGGEYGVCLFEDGSECEEWAFYNDACKPGECEKWETCDKNPKKADEVKEKTDEGAPVEEAKEEPAEEKTAEQKPAEETNQ